MSVYFVFYSMDLFRHEKPEIVSAAFYAVVSLEARIAMVDEVLQVAVADTVLRKRWANLRKRTKDRALVRNKLAHLTVTSVTSGDTGRSTLKLTPTVFKISSRRNVEHDTKASLTMCSKDGFDLLAPFVDVNSTPQ